jgi:hypothetical protein
MAEPQTTAAPPPAVTFIDEPGVSGFDKMFGNTPAEPEPEDAAASEPNEEAAPDPTPEPSAPAAVSPDVALQLATLAEQNRQLAAQLGQIVNQRSTETLQALMSKWEDAVATGDTEAAERLRKEVEAFKAQPPAPAYQPAPLTAPAGHWSYNIKGEAEAWTAAQPWWRVDGARTKAVMDAANIVDPAKFATRDAYFAALTDAADELIGRKRAAAEPPTPTPRVAGGSTTRGTSTRQAGEITSISQLRGEERAAAEAAINYGGLTEAQYLASYNDVRRMMARAKKG